MVSFFKGVLQNIARFKWKQKYMLQLVEWREKRGLFILKGYKRVRCMKKHLQKIYIYKKDKKV